MADAIFGSPIFFLTPAEEARILNDEANRRQEQTAWEKENNAAPFSSFVSGARSSSVIGAGIYRGVQKALQSWDPSGSPDPLNIAKSKSEYNPATDPMSHGMDNNIDSITQDMQGIPFEEYPYVLSATSHADFKDRLDFVKTGLPEIQARMKGNVGLGKAVGMATDLSAMMAIGAAAEPFALVGLGTRTSLAGKAVYEASSGLQPLAEAVTAAAETVGRTHLAFRYGALGIAEEAMFQAVKEGIDPNSNPDASDVLFNLTLAGGISGILGGALFGRTFVRQSIQEAADDLKRMRVTDLPGGYTINVAPNWAFSSTANADGVMFARGFGTADELGVELHADWEKTGDMFIPGSRTVSNITVTSGSFRSGTVDIGGEITRFPPYEEAVNARVVPEDLFRGPRSQNIVNEVATAKPITQSTATTANKLEDGIITDNKLRRETQQAKWLESVVEVKPNDPRWERAKPTGQFPTLTSKGKPKYEGEVRQANLAEVLPEGRTTVFHEGNLGNVQQLVSRITQGDRMHGYFFVSDNIDLALGQKGGKGYIIELNASFVNGRAATGKNLEFSKSMGLGSEFVVDKTTKQSIVSITVPNQGGVEKLRKVRNMDTWFDFDNPVITERGIKLVRKRKPVVDQAAATPPATPAGVAKAADEVATAEPKPEDLFRGPPSQNIANAEVTAQSTGAVSRKIYEATAFAKRLFHTISEPTDLLNILRNGTSMGKIKLNVVAEEGAIRLEFAANKLKGSVAGNVDRATYESSNIGLDITTNPRTLSKRLKGVTVKVSQINEDDLVTVRNALHKAGLKELPQVGDELRFIRPGSKVKPGKMIVRGAASTVKTIVKSLEDLGVPVDQELFKKVSRGVLAAEQSRLAGKAFNTRLWEEVIKEVGNPQQAQLISEALLNRVLPRFSTVDRNVLSVASRENMITAIHKGFKSKMHLDPANPQSLIFQVLENIEKRGGTVDREMVAGVIDDLRSIVQNPPKRLNKLGRKTIDTFGRRRAVVDIINKRVQGIPGATPIEIPNNLLKKMSRNTMAPVSGGGGAGATGMGVGGAEGSPTFENVPRVTLRVPILSNFLNQAALAMQSENGMARYMAHIAFNARRVHDGVQPTTKFEYGMQVVQSLLFHFTVGYRNGSTKFAMGVKGETVTDSPTLINAVLSRFGKRNKEIAREFDERVSAVMRSGTPDAVAAVNETAEGFKKLVQRVHNIAFETGVSGFTNSGIVNYLPRLWRFERIRRLTGTQEGMNDLITLLKTSFENGGRKVIIDGVEQTIEGDLRQAAVVFANRLKRIAFETENAPLLAQDQELVDSLAGLIAPLKGKGTSKTPFGRSRIMLDELAGITATADHLNIGTTNLRLADLVSNDLPLIFKRYTTSVMGAVNEKSFLNSMNEAAIANGVKGPMVDGVQQPFKKFTSLDEVIDTAKLVAGPINPNHESGLREVLSAMRFEPLHSGTAEFSDKAKGILMSYGYLVKGGQFGLAQLGETARVVGTLGLTKTIKQMPILQEMVNNWWNLDRPTQNFASWIDSWMSPSTDRLRRQFISVGLDMNEREAKGVRGGLDMAANLLADVSGLAPLTSWTQQLTAATTMQHLWEVANRGVSRLDNATLKGLGLTSDQYERLVAYVGRNAEIKEGFLGERVVGMMNMDKVEMDLLRNMVDRCIRTRIQDMPTRGDFAKSLFGFWGSAATQFRSFNLKGIDNFLLQNVGRVQQGGGKRVAAEIGSTLLFSGIIAYGRNYADWRSYKNTTDTEKTKELESTLTAGGFVRGAVAGPSEFFLGILGADAAWQGLVDPDPIFSQYRYSGQSTFGFPLEDTLKRTYGLSKDLYGATVAKATGSNLSREFTQRTLHSGRLSLLGQNLPGFKQFLNVAESEIADYYRLPKTQPRDR